MSPKMKYTAPVGAKLPSSEEIARQRAFDRLAARRDRTEGESSVGLPVHDGVGGMS